MQAVVACPRIQIFGQAIKAVAGWLELACLSCQECKLTVAGAIFDDFLWCQIRFEVSSGFSP